MKNVIFLIAALLLATAACQGGNMSSVSIDNQAINKAEIIKTQSGNADEFEEYNLPGVLTLLGYLKYSSDIQDGGDPALLFDEVLMIRSHETEKLRQYGYDPEVDIIENDYVMINEVEEWMTIVTNASASYTIIVYDYDADMVVQFVEVDRQGFLQHLNDKGEILAKITIAASGTLYDIKEEYVP